MKTAVIAINIGTPAQPNPEAVGNYLRKFLMDPLVIDIPFPLRWVLVNLMIIPKRKKDSAKLYEKIWTEKGSPLLLHSENFVRGLQEKLGGNYLVELGMRYGSPSIEEVVNKLKRSHFQGRVVAFPLYPQYSLAATESSIKFLRKCLAGAGMSSLPLIEIPPFYQEKGFLDAFAEVARNSLSQISYDHLLFSFHGLPERQVKKVGHICFEKEDCCDTINEKNRLCYRAQSFYTAKAIAERLKLEPAKYDICFQSRLNDRWIPPFTDHFYRTLPQKGVKRLAVICPSFVADCLETLEEVALRGDEEFRRHGGEKVTLIPSLNAEVSWISAAATLVKRCSETHSSIG